LPQAVGRSAVYNFFMIETLYKTHTPEKGKSECYVLVLTCRAASSGKVYAFMEEHGQWNDEMQRFVYKVNSIATEEQLTYQHARGMYERAKGNLVRKGFVHCFGPDGVRKEPACDQERQPESALA
jgi:hypothetical protein